MAGWAAALSVMAASVCLRADTFQESFEACDAGVLHGQNGWSVSLQNNAQVQNATAFGGSNAVAMTTNTTAWHTFNDPTATNVWVDFYARLPTPGDDGDPVLTGSVAAAFFVTSVGSIKAVSNDSWVTLSPDPPLVADTWYRLTVNLDYGSRRWALYLADSTPNKLATTVATNLAFSGSSTNAYFRRFRVKH
jgi:hypothetical protein